MHDERDKRLYVAVGSPGTVTVFDTERLAEVQTVETEEGAHTIGWDPATAQLYAFAPQRGGALVFSETG
jgi:DNA-binding beta-propeller fold protein YncE